MKNFNQRASRQGGEAIFEGIEKAGIEVDSREAEQLFSLGQELASMDLGADRVKGAIYDQVRAKAASKENEVTSRRGRTKAKRFHSIVKAASILTILAVGFASFQPAFAQSVVGKILKMLSLDNIIAIQNQRPVDGEPLPAWLEGQVFDAAGNPIITYHADQVENYYNAEGVKLMDLYAASADEEEVDTLRLTDLAEINRHANFTVVLPAYLPEGYEFEYGEFYLDEQGGTSGDYLDLYFIHAETQYRLFLQMRNAENKDTAYILSSEENIEQIQINGVEAIVVGERGVHWENEKVIYTMYELSRNGHIPKEELIQTAKSIQP